MILSNLHSYVSENKENLPQVPIAKEQKKRSKSSPALARRSIENKLRKQQKSNDREENNKEPNWVRNILRYEMVDTPVITPLQSRTRHCKNHKEGNKQTKRNEIQNLPGHPRNSAQRNGQYGSGKNYNNRNTISEPMR